MKIPKTIKVLGVIFKVEIVSDKELKEELAECRPVECLIKINETAPHEQQCVGLIHEILHAIDWTLSESKVDVLAPALYCVLKENNLLR